VAEVLSEAREVAIADGRHAPQPRVLQGCQRVRCALTGMALVLCLSLMALQARAETVFYPRAEADGDVRADYAVLLLRMALERSGENWQLAPSRVVMPQGRALLELAKDSRLVDIVWSGTSKEREETLLPIRIGIYKGLLGWRISLVRGGNAELLKNVKTLDDLKKFTAGQGLDWPDVDVLRVNGIKVDGSNRYENLFSMLQHDRLDFLPRSLVEVGAEADRYGKDGIVADRYLLIRYPYACYYFVNRKNLRLADAVAHGLEAAIADGSFDTLFYQYNGPMIERAELGKRVIIDLTNPGMPDATPYKRRELWYHMGDLEAFRAGHK